MSVITGQKRSKEELEALEVAEDSREKEWSKPSFIGDLFMGRFDISALAPFPLQEAGDKKIGDDYIGKIRPFFENEYDAGKVDETGVIPESSMKSMAALGLFGLKIPREFGGVGLSQTNYDRVLAFVGRHCASLGATLSAHQSIGLPQPLILFGTDAQKRKYLPDIARGALSAFALTEPDVGSDPAQMSTTAIPSSDGEHYIINGKKLWCTNGVTAKYIVVMALTPADKNAGGKKQISAFIVETNTPGFKVLHRCRFMGLSGIQNGLLEFTDVKVPKENIVWGLGKGLRLALITLNTGRLSLPAACVGGAQESLRMIREWGGNRKQWGTVIGKHEAGAHKLAMHSAHLFAMEAVTWLSCAWVDRKSHDIRLEAAMAKVFCSLTSHRLLDEAIQFRAGRGYERRESLKARGEAPYPLEQMYRDSRINQIVEGTSEIMRLFIAREALDRHLKLAGEILNPKASIGTKLSTLVKAGLFYTYWYPRQWLSCSIWPMFAGYGSNGCHMRFVSRTAHRLARTTFHLMLLNGPKLERRQAQLMRLVEIATDLLAMAASVSRARALKESGASTHAEAVADLFCREARQRICTHFRSICWNSDKQASSLGKKVLEGELTWQERAI